FGWMYLTGFIRDSAGIGSRDWLASEIEARLSGPRPLALRAEPAPYCQPPADLFETQWWLLPEGYQIRDPLTADGYMHIEFLDARRRISWADKPFVVSAGALMIIAP